MEQEGPPAKRPRLLAPLAPYTTLNSPPELDANSGSETSFRDSSYYSDWDNYSPSRASSAPVAVPAVPASPSTPPVHSTSDNAPRGHLLEQQAQCTSADERDRICFGTVGRTNGSSRV